jgi:glycosyltransferase involved in cell wall biosynthesis
MSPVPGAENESHTAPLRALALTSYPLLAAATRYRVDQFRGPLSDRGISLDVRPFLDDAGLRHLYGTRVSSKLSAVGRGLLRRTGDVVGVHDYDVVVVQREAMLIGPPIVEWLVSTIGAKPIVLDIDDPIWLPEQSQVPGVLSKVRRWPGKVHWLLRHATLVICGNHILAEYVTSLGGQARVVPNAVDTGRLRPSARSQAAGAPPLVGWIGSHGTYPYLEAILPSLEEVGRRAPFRMLVVGSGRPSVPIEGVQVDVRRFDLGREVDDFASLDIGLYPLPDEPWAAGKSGLKAVQYLAVGVPYIASPVGIVAEIGVPGVTHFLANDAADWRAALISLLEDQQLRAEMGAAGRRHAELNHDVSKAADLLAQALRDAAGR